MNDIEIARRVAEACGWPYQELWWRPDLGEVVREPQYGWDSFDPVNRLDDAFLAAEAVGLFEEPEGRLYKANGQWCLDWDGVTSVQYVTAETPAKVICFAVLNLKGVPPTEPSP